MAFGMLTSQQRRWGYCTPMLNPVMSYPLGSVCTWGRYNPFGVSLFAPPIMNYNYSYYSNPYKSWNYNTVPLTLNTSYNNYGLSSYSNPYSSWNFNNYTPKFNFTNWKLTMPTWNNTSYNTNNSNLSIGDTFEKSSNNSQKISYNKTTGGNVKHWTEMSDNEMKQVYGNYERDITTPYNGSASDLNKYLSRYGNNSVLKDKGDVFIKAQQKYGISALVLLAICGIETTYGTKGNAKKGYNVANIRPRGSSTGFRRFNNVEECVMELARLLRENYVDNPGKSGVHLTKLYQVNSKYCPSSVDNNDANWAQGVENCIASIQRA